MPRHLRTLVAVVAMAIAICPAMDLAVSRAGASTGTAVNADRGSPERAAAKKRAAAKRAAIRRRAAARKRAAAKRAAMRRRAAARKRRSHRRSPVPKPPATPNVATPTSPSPVIEPGSQPVPPSSPSSASNTRLFAPTSVWNAPLAADVPLDPRSDGLVAALAAEVRREVDGNFGPWINFDKYSVPVYTVGADVPTVRVTLDAWNPALQRDFDAVPIPEGAREAAGDDRHLTVYQPSTDTLWEFWLARRAADGWHARWGGKMTDVSSNPGYFPNPYGASATSLPLLGGLMTIRELEAGQIDHALALAVPNTAAGSFTWPAQRGDGRTAGPDGIPEGTHLRIDPSLDLARLNLSPLALAMARAAQRYGIIIRDTAGCVVFYGEDPIATPGDPYGRIFGGDYPNRLLGGFPWGHLQVVAPPGT